MLWLPLVVLACSSLSSDVPVGFRLPRDAVLVVHETTTSTTRTPLGPEQVQIKSTRRMEARQGGRSGHDALAWHEVTTRYAVTWTTRAGEIAWDMASEEPLPEALAGVGPSSPRVYTVTPSEDVWVEVLPWPKKDEEAEAEVADTAPPPRGERRQLQPRELPSWLAGLIAAPAEPQEVGATWSWTAAQQVTGGGEVSSTSIWKVDRLAGSEAVLLEQISLSSAMPPASDEFRTTALSGAGELRIDTETGLPISYTSSWEADLASPSSRGTSTLKTSVTFRERR